MSTLLEILHGALDAKHGIEVRSTNPIQLRQDLYAEMRKQKDQGDGSFDGLVLSLSPIDPQSYLWVTHAKAETPPTKPPVQVPHASGA